MARYAGMPWIFSCRGCILVSGFQSSVDMKRFPDFLLVDVDWFLGVVIGRTTRGHLLPEPPKYGQCPARKALHLQLRAFSVL